MSNSSVIEIPEPKLSGFIFADTRVSIIWFVIRIYVGWQWLVTGFEKIQNPAWVGLESGVALKVF